MNYYCCAETLCFVHPAAALVCVNFGKMTNQLLRRAAAGEKLPLPLHVRQCWKKGRAAACQWVATFIFDQRVLMLRWLLAARTYTLWCLAGWLSISPAARFASSKLSLDQIVANFFSFYSDALNQRDICMTSVENANARTYINGENTAMWAMICCSDSQIKRPIFCLTA